MNYKARETLGPWNKMADLVIHGVTPQELWINPVGYTVLCGVKLGKGHVGTKGWEGITCPDCRRRLGLG